MEQGYDLVAHNYLLNTHSALADYHTNGAFMISEVSGPVTISWTESNPVFSRDTLSNDDTCNTPIW